MFKENDRFKVSFVNTNYYLLEIKDDVNFNIEDFKQLVAFEKELSGKQLPVLILSSPSAGSDNDLLSYASKNINNPYCKAEALVINSLAQKILLNVYVKLKKPERPAKFFKKKEEAIKWLEQFFEL
ncbi:MAG: hypothetical protein H0W73_12845 [Bacteroidetes bacterium]|nr:hypothetical protein [Bacteroidota bacterium]